MGGYVSCVIYSLLFGERGQKFGFENPRYNKENSKCKLIWVQVNLFEFYSFFFAFGVYIFLFVFLNQ